MIGITARRLSRAGYPRRLARAQAQRLPFPQAAFDSIVATFPSGYIIDRATLAEARRVLRSGGRMVIVLAAALGGDGIYARLIDLAYRLTLQGSPRHALEEQPRSLVGHNLSQAGFAVVERWQPLGRDRVHVVIGTCR